LAVRLGTPIRVSQQIDALHVKPDMFHGEWNYAILPMPRKKLIRFFQRSFMDEDRPCFADSDVPD
jgi:hypothetical protein